MSLAKCRDCGQEVSTAAAFCPKCGRPIKKKTSPLAIGCLGILGFGLLAAIVGQFSHPNQSTSTPRIDSFPEKTLSPAEIAAAKKEEEKAEATFLRTPAGKIWKKHPGWSREDCATIAAHKVNIGMTSEQVRAAWGRPQRVNADIFKDLSGIEHRRDQWVMNDSEYVYFTDGVMTTLQQSK